MIRRLARIAVIGWCFYGLVQLYRWFPREIFYWLPPKIQEFGFLTDKDFTNQKELYIFWAVFLGISILVLGFFDICDILFKWLFTKRKNG